MPQRRPGRGIERQLRPLRPRLPLALSLSGPRRSLGGAAFFPLPPLFLDQPLSMADTPYQERRAPVPVQFVAGSAGASRQRAM